MENESSAPAVSAGESANLARGNPNNGNGAVESDGSSFTKTESVGKAVTDTATAAVDSAKATGKAMGL